MTNGEAIRNLDAMWKMLTSAYDDIADSFVVAYTMAVDVLKAQMVKSDDLKVESAQNVQNGDLISRNLAIDELYKMLHDYFWTDDEELDAIIATLNDLPSVQREPLSDAYMKAVWTWLLDYQIKVAELKGRYTPYEVLSWVSNDWRKEHEQRSNQQTGGD